MQGGAQGRADKAKAAAEGALAPHARARARAQQRTLTRCVRRAHPSSPTTTRAAPASQLASEIEIHRSLDHPNIVRFVDSAEDDARVYLLLELCAGRSLHELVVLKKRLSEAEAGSVLLQVVRATSYLHARNVLHRDIKLSNLFVHHGAVKLGDFGLSARLLSASERRETVCGTPNYVAPEVIARSRGLAAEEEGAARPGPDARPPTPRGHSFPADVWSIGVVLYALVTGRAPFDGRGDVKRTYARIREGGVVFPRGLELSAEVRGLIVAMLDPAPERRPSLDAVATHPFVERALGPAPPTRTPGPRASPTAPPGAAGVEQPRACVAPTAPPGAAAAEQPRACVAPAEGCVGGAGEWTSARRALRPLAEPVAQQHPGARERTPPVRLSVAPAFCAHADAGACVARWVDMRSRFGVGYELLGGSVGAWFNDGTRMVRSADGALIQYRERARPDGCAPAHGADTSGEQPGGSAALSQQQLLQQQQQQHAQGCERALEFDAYAPPPARLAKKWALLHHFAALLQRRPHDTVPASFGAGCDGGRTPRAEFAHVRRSLCTAAGGGCTVFRLSRRWLQLLFEDGMEVLLPPPPLQAQGEPAVYVPPSAEACCAPSAPRAESVAALSARPAARVTAVLDALGVHASQRPPAAFLAQAADGVSLSSSSSALLVLLR